jgi:hypothetical protein
MTSKIPKDEKNSNPEAAPQTYAAYSFEPIQFKSEMKLSPEWDKLIADRIRQILVEEVKIEVLSVTGNPAMECTVVLKLEIAHSRQSGEES